MLKTFATLSAMAIQNARLFREIADKGRQFEVASQHKSNFLASMIGIPPDKIGSLFTEFKQTDATIASEYGGTGLRGEILRVLV